MGGDLLLTGDEKIDKAIINLQKQFDSLQSKSTLTVAGKDYVVSNSETYSVYEMETGASNKTITLPLLSQNKNKSVIVIKTDSGAGYATVAGKVNDKINGFASIVIEKQNCGLELKSSNDGTAWMVMRTIGECEIQTIGSAVELVYVKIISSSGDSAPAHGVDIDKIITMIPILSYSIYRYSPNYYDGANNWFPLLTATTVSLLPTGVFAGQNWSVEIKYYI